MKKKLLATILGLAAVAPAFGQGHLLISNYAASPYNQVFWNATTPGFGNQAVRAEHGIVLTLWYGEGVITDQSLLIQGVSFGILGSGGSEDYDPGAGHGPGGYYLAPDQVLATWQPGDTFTFQIRAGGNTAFGVLPDGWARSALWQENAAIAGAANPANANTFSAGLMIPAPEPSSMALAGAGFVSLFIFRRSKQRRLGQE